MTASGQARRWILLCLVMGGGLSPACAGADGFERLDRFFEKVDTFKASFIQVVLDENLLALEESSGLLWIARPGRFRWDYESVHPQTIVADGQVLWVYDIELEQVTRTPLSDLLRNGLQIGLLGGFTTFSAFSIDAITLFDQGLWLRGLLYIVTTVVVSVLGAYLGMSVGRNF